MHQTTQRAASTIVEPSMPVPPQVWRLAWTRNPNFVGRADELLIDGARGDIGATRVDARGSTRVFHGRNAGVGGLKLATVTSRVWPVEGVPGCPADSGAAMSGLT